MAKLMAAQADAENDPMFEMMKNLPRVLEINPKSPLIEGLLDRVLDLPEEDSIDEDLTETAQVLFDTTLVRSGFTVADPTSYFERVEALLRRSLGVSLTAKGSVDVKPAPPTAMGPISEDGVDGEIGDIEIDDNVFISRDGGKVDEGGEENWLDWADLKKQQQTKQEIHDEL